MEAAAESGGGTTGVAVVGVGVSLGESFGTGVASSHSLVLWNSLMRSGVERARVGDVGADGARDVPATVSGGSGEAPAPLGPGPETSVGARGGSARGASALGGRSAAVLDDADAGGMETEDEDAEGGSVCESWARREGFPSQGARGEWRSSGDAGFR